MGKKRVALLEPEERPDSKGFTDQMGLALVDGLLKSKGLTKDERATLILLKDDLGRSEIAGGSADFFDNFFENDVTIRLVFRGLERYIALRRERKTILPLKKSRGRRPGRGE